MCFKSYIFYITSEMNRIGKIAEKYNISEFVILKVIKMV